jgi:hypothetical protein
LSGRHADHAAFKWRRTSFTLVDGAIEADGGRQAREACEAILEAMGIFS